MNKSELVQSLAAQAAITRSDAQRAVNALFDAERGIIATALRRGERVQITGFGTFEMRERKARTGRNPRTGQEIRIAATISPMFRPGKALRETTRKKK